MDYETMIVGSTTDVLSKVMDFIPTLVIGIALLVIGCILVQVIEKIFTEVFKLIKLDMVLESIKVTDALKKGGITTKPSKMLTSLICIIFMLIVLMITVNAFNMHMDVTAFDAVIMFIPKVVNGIIMLIGGLLLAKFASVIIYVVASNTGMPGADLISKLVKLPIMVYVGILYLGEVGFFGLFTGVHYDIFMAGVVLSLALAFGLAGRDVAGKYLDSLKK